MSMPIDCPRCDGYGYIDADERGRPLDDGDWESAR